METEREKIKQIRNLMLLGAALVLMLIHSRELLGLLWKVVDIVKPFLLGGVIAFALNLPVKAIEENLFVHWEGKSAEVLKRPVSILLSVLLILFLLSLTMGMVIPQLAQSITEIGRKIPVFMEQMSERLEHLSASSNVWAKQMEDLNIAEMNGSSLMAYVTDFLENGAGDVLNSTVSMAGSVVSGVTRWAVAFVFAVYVLAQKEKLGNQAGRILSAYFPDKMVRRIRKVVGLLYQNFSKFITGQCLEAVILGTMFVVCMSILRLPYPLVIGMVIAVTALIPIVGAFLGCVIGVFLILMESPLQALWFVILFFVLQQIEGNLIYPRVVGNSVGLPAIWVLVAISIGGSLFGIPGMLLFIPLMSTFYTLLKEDVNKRNARKSAG